MNLMPVIEGLLFIRGDEGITLSEIKDVMGIDNDVLQKLILDFQDEMLLSNRGLKLEKFGDILKLTTKREHSDYYKRLVEMDELKPLSGSTLETLAIIAYNNPITRIDVDDIRGVSSAHLVRNLMNRGLVEVAGKADKPGKPNLYGITNKFFDVFGITNLNDLPELKDFEIEEINETDLFETKYVEK